jgi:lysophospholipid acyltransferase (LPLAT)-like uncharacterized protein
VPRWSLRVVSWLGRGYLRVVGFTSRFGFEGMEGAEAARAREGPVLWVMWHNRVLGPLYPYRGRRVGVVISRSRDGELISRVVRGFGYVPLRGSSTRGGFMALRAVVRHLRQGNDVVFTPDGPRGPRYTVQPGVTYVARKTGHPVIPVGVGMSKKLVFGSWDRFQVPLPFGTVQIVFCEPLWFGPDDAEADVAEAIRSALSAGNEAADLQLGVRSP